MTVVRRRLFILAVAVLATTAATLAQAATRVIDGDTIVVEGIGTVRLIEEFIGARGDVRDAKRNAGASRVVRRQVIRPNKQPPKWVATNIEVPAIPVGRQTLHFFPDRLIVVDPAGVGAVSYESLMITVSPTRFIESDGVPKDAQVVGQTWKYVNKKGGPDKRFKDNRELPIALYEKIHFGSPTGLNEVIQVSRVGTGELLDAARQDLSAMPAGRPHPPAGSLA